MDARHPHPLARCAADARAVAGRCVAVVVLVVALGAGLALGELLRRRRRLRPRRRRPRTAAPKTNVDITLGDVSADSAGAPVTIAADQSQHVLDALTTYVKGATVQPLRSAKPATADFGAVFDAATLASATTTDRGVMLDEGLPR